MNKVFVAVHIHKHGVNIHAYHSFEAARAAVAKRLIGYADHSGDLQWKNRFLAEYKIFCNTPHSTWDFLYQVWKDEHPDDTIEFRECPVEE